MRVRWRVLAAVAFVAFAAVAFVNLADRDSSTSSGPSDASLFVRAYQGLCAAIDAATRQDTDEAHGVFLGRSHQTLHAIAAEVADTDRAAAARLLEAKAAVEEALPVGAASAEADLRRLAAATAEAIEALDETCPPPCP